MPKLRFEISISLDGYIAGLNQSEEHPLGELGCRSACPSRHAARQTG